MLGLSDENMQRLKKGEPIKFNLNELGLPENDVIIFNGRTEQSMYEEMKEQIHPYKTVLKNSRAKEN